MSSAADSPALSGSLPLASLATWGSHAPDAAAPTEIRLRCALLDLFRSSNFPPLSHASGPYFVCSAPRYCFHATLDITNAADRAALTTIGLDRVPNVKNLYFYVSSDKKLKPSETEYTVRGLAFLYDSNGLSYPDINAACSDEFINARIVLVWGVKDGCEDITPSIGWDCLAGILQHQSTIKFQLNGVEKPLGTDMAAAAYHPDPLIHLGYLG